MKEVKESKLIHSTLRAKLLLNKTVIFKENQIANTFNNFFINIGSKLADDIPS